MSEEKDSTDWSDGGSPPLEIDESSVSETSDLSDEELPSKRITLSPFQELRGELLSMHRSGSWLYVMVSCGTLRLRVDSAAAGICERDLSGHEGSIISILRVPDSPSPLRTYIHE